MLEKTKKILVFSLCWAFLSCSTLKHNVHPYISVYEIEYYVPNIFKSLLVFKHSPQTYELYLDGSGGVLGHYTIINDTLTLHHEYEYSCEGSKMVLTAIDSTDTFTLSPRKYLIRKDSLIDITYYPNPTPDFVFKDHPFSPTDFRQNYILAKGNSPIKGN